jgi:oligopeptide transport system substrate-binding protein
VPAIELSTLGQTHYSYLHEKGDYDFARAAWVADCRDPENFLGIYRKASGINYSNYDNPK